MLWRASISLVYPPNPSPSSPLPLSIPTHLRSFIPLGIPSRKRGMEVVNVLPSGTVNGGCGVFQTTNDFRMLPQYWNCAENKTPTFRITIQRKLGDKTGLLFQGQVDDNGSYKVELIDRKYSGEAGDIEIELIARLEWGPDTRHLGSRSDPTLEAPQFGFSHEGSFHLSDLAELSSREVHSSHVNSSIKSRTYDFHLPMSKKISNCKYNLFENDTAKNGKRKKIIDLKFGEQVRSKKVQVILNTEGFQK
ncbi:hypothetical protein CPB84DRAFT_648082 [Gymnopilus junonius]|uniref:Uncharacterized protein n=1 Tax=Gymnopilus junonius TaxID=109634 RepID=A0A9P5N9P6_GYMJU|nr:hypothetical protein CPB84DRAFT_648082 [Gymnopilus junonius]